MTKPYTLCSTPRSILVRCQVDSTQQWHFVCPGACWKSVSGGVEDARGMQDIALGIDVAECGRIEAPMDRSVPKSHKRPRRDSNRKGRIR
ncbi:hypothetical protein K458DRAFT_452485 [Lentithecium fluviatile CBS 122367]|uniref:Uncharacterized protein n=1 Tax=Lentithecium fluviatile CBS 122367 TaxID=1168545 RepID=A0A6G1J0C4_9PLEO|nr:hypothetical protein K458DRAFT_452485 [Lentithecium fluviatile CBS 122367]